MLPRFQKPKSGHLLKRSLTTQIHVAYCGYKFSEVVRPRIQYMWDYYPHERCVKCMRNVTTEFAQKTQPKYPSHKKK